MEFSFDRSKNSNDTRASEHSQTQAQNNTQSAGPRPGPDLNTVDPSTIANERLRKAIERNRAKQAERDAGRDVGRETGRPAPQPQAQPQYVTPEQVFSPPRETRETYVAPKAEPVQPTYSHSEAQAQATQENHEQASFFANASAQANMHAQHSEGQEIPRARENVRPRSTSVVSRRTTAKPEDTEFVPAKRTTRKVASQISYATGSSARKKTKSMDPKYVGWLVKGSWIFCAIMVLRLIFAAGGVTDYYSQKTLVNARISELNDIKKENMTLVREIERMRSDTGFQKKLVRDNLGFIASDEFLVLFPKGK